MPGKGSFAQRQIGPDAPSGPGPVALDSMQATLLRKLQQAEGSAVSFAELQDAGVEFPASVVSELELAGVPIERTVLDTAGDKAMGVALDPAWTASGEQSRARAGAVPGGPAYGDARVTRDLRSLWAADIARWLAPAALLVAFVAAGALAIVQLGSSGQSKRVGRVQANRATESVPQGARAGSHAKPGKREVRPALQVPVSPQLASRLQARGHELLEAGRYTGAVAVLTRAVAATGERLEDCRQPVSETCLTYAYGLYDLGRALALGGHPGEAVPVLERRLQIDNQRPTVASELERARAQAG